MADEPQHAGPGAIALGEELAGRARDAAYTAVGLGILGFQRLQVRRHALAQRLSDEPGAAPGGPFGELRVVLASGARQLDGWMEEALSLVDAGVAPIEDQLPPVARAVVSRGRALGSHLHEIVRSVA
jgi:hypothetical protein